MTGLLVDKDQELDFGGYSGDLLSATLSTSVRVASLLNLDVQIVRAIQSPVMPPTTQTNTVNSAMVVDQAVASLASNAPASRPAATGGNKKAKHPKHHPVTIKVKHSVGGHNPKGSSHSAATEKHVKTGGTPAKHAPDGKLALGLSGRGANVAGSQHKAVKARPGKIHRRPGH